MSLDRRLTMIDKLAVFLSDDIEIIILLWYNYFTSKA